jgi:uncharacterized protein
LTTRGSNSGRSERAQSRLTGSAHRVGNVATVRLGALADTPAQIQFGADKHDRLPAQCRVCPWLAACNGGCPKDRFGVTADGEPRLNYLCDGLRRFFAYADPVLRRLVDVARSGARWVRTG